MFDAEEEDALRLEDWVVRARCVFVNCQLSEERSDGEGATRMKIHGTQRE